MRWTSITAFLSAAALAAAVASQLVGRSDVRGWFLLAWAVLLLPVAVGLLSHPMRAPAWGLFAGFWGVIAVVGLIVLQALAVTGVLGGKLTAWPLVVIGFWIIVASVLGFGAERFPVLVDLLGIIAGLALISIALATGLGNADLLKVAGLASAVTYCLWALGLAWVFGRMQRVTHRFRGVAFERRL